MDSPVEPPARDYTPVVEGCFACGTVNPLSLNLRPYRQAGGVAADFTPLKNHRGYSNVVHGGITCAVLDEVMGAAAALAVSDWMATVEIQVRYRKPFFVGTPVRVEGWVESVDGRKVMSRGRIVDEAGDAIVQAEATFVTVPREKLSQFVPKVASKPDGPRPE